MRAAMGIQAVLRSRRKDEYKTFNKRLLDGYRIDRHLGVFRR